MKHSSLQNKEECFCLIVCRCGEQKNRPVVLDEG
ncbi:hypothetical protein I656_03937 [Geobacillus sp. WSUCF1]|nr:hypothetical protein I656_03937 [Geobacillus sp. WSUCF1]